MRYILIQPVSQIGDEPGRFRNTFTGEEVDTLDVVPIKVQKRRVLNPLEYGKPSLCASHDGLYSLAAFGDGTPTAYPLRECRTCPQFSDSEWGRNQELCAPEYLVWAYRPTAHEIVEMNL